MDEACSALRVALDSRPEALESLQQQVMRLRVEEEALKKEGDAASKARLEEVRTELANVQEQLAPLEVRYGAEKARLDALQALQTKRDATLSALREAEARYDLPRVADLKYGALAELDAALAKLQREAPETPMLSDTVTPEDVAAVVARWTGIPVTRLGVAEQSRLLHLGERLHERVVGQHAAVAAVADAVLRSRAGLAARTRGASFIFLGPSGVGKTETAKALATELFGACPVLDIAARLRVLTSPRHPFRHTCRLRKEHDPHRHERVHGEARGVAPHRRAAGLHRPR